MSEQASRRMTKVAALLLASLGVVTAAWVLWSVGSGGVPVADATIGEVLVTLAFAAAWSAPAFLAAVAFGRRPGSPAERGYAVLVALGYGALGLFGAWIGWATTDNFSEEAYDQWDRLAVTGAVLVVLSGASLRALRLAMGAVTKNTSAPATVSAGRHNTPKRYLAAVLLATILALAWFSLTAPILGPVGYLGWGLAGWVAGRITELKGWEAHIPVYVISFLAVSISSATSGF